MYSSKAFNTPSYWGKVLSCPSTFPLPLHYHWKENMIKIHRRWSSPRPANIFLIILQKNKHKGNVRMQSENPCWHHVFRVLCWIQLERNVEAEESCGRVYQIILPPSPGALNAMPCKNKWIVYCVPCKFPNPWWSPAQSWRKVHFSPLAHLPSRQNRQGFFFPLYSPFSSRGPSVKPPFHFFPCL